MKKLDNHEACVPGKFRYFVPETKVWFRDVTIFSVLVDKVRAHYKANGLTAPPDLQEKMEDFICEEIPDGYCTEGGHPVVTLGTGKQTLSLPQMVSGTLTLARWLVSGRQKVSEDQANKRAAICVGCRWNQPAMGCTSCNRGQIDRAVESVVGGSRTMYHDQLNACTVCGCGLRAKVWLPIESLKETFFGPKIGQFPEWCWLRKESEG